MKRTAGIAILLIGGALAVTPPVEAGAWVRGRGGVSVGVGGGGVRVGVGVGWGYPRYGWGYPGYGWGYPYRYGGWYGGPYFGAYWRAPYPYYVPVAVPVETAARRAGTLETSVKPKKARVLVDGDPVGQARDFNGPWDLLALTPGTRTVEFALDGYQTLRVNVEVTPGGHYRVEEKLQMGEGLDPRSHKPTAETPAPVTPTAAPPAYDPLAPPPAEESRLSKGMLTIRATPPDAAIYLDGDFLASAAELSRLHGALPVASGEHTIQVVRPGFQEESVVIVVEPGEPRKVRLDLQPDQ